MLAVSCSCILAVLEGYMSGSKPGTLSVVVYVFGGDGDGCNEENHAKWRILEEVYIQQ